MLRHGLDVHIILCNQVTRIFTLRAKLWRSVYRPIVIGPVCVFVGLCVCVFVGGSVTTITRNCVHRSPPNLDLVKVETISSWLNFGRPASPERGSAAGRNFLAPLALVFVFVSVCQCLRFTERFFIMCCIYRDNGPVEESDSGNDFSRSSRSSDVAWFEKNATFC